MCDCYKTECQGCGRAIQVHIGDFSQSRENVRAWCPKCHGEFVKMLAAQKYDTCYKMFASPIATDGKQVAGLKRGVVIFLVADPHGVYLN